MSYKMEIEQQYGKCLTLALLDTEESFRYWIAILFLNKSSCPYIY